MARPAAYGRLFAAAWTLARHDALLPVELEAQYPGPIRDLGRALRLLGGKQARDGRPGERLARALVQLGPVAIKLGQLLSTRADIFGVQFAEDLSRLKDRLPPFPAEIARAQVEAALGAPIETQFSEFGEAVAAASLAQAHDARLRDGRRVAVKVLRPNIGVRVAQDSAAVALAAQLVARYVPAARRLEPLAFAQTVIRATELELDLRLEAAGCDELGEVMARDGYMAAPAVIWEGVGKQVLTLEWAAGAPLSDPAALELPGLDRPTLASNLLRAFLSQALDHGVFHADLHEGNLFVEAPAKITAVDYGIVGRLGPDERRYLAEILWGFLDRDYPRVAEVHFRAGYVPAHHDRAAFAQALRAVGEPVFGRAASQVSMSRVLIQLFEITALFDMHLRPELVLLQKTMMTVEGVARRIDPDHDIWAAADPVVRRWIARELAPPAQAKRLAQESLDILQGLKRRLQTPEPRIAVVADPDRDSSWLWFFLGALTAGGAFLLGALA
ncbi:2-polyprenylphenol 6-hydroxylase [Phenylobacterium sp.]|uniref:2-polyprenylphenol 6-hydroxylase n=1 Tax=Phenylobacterium sp. TaxID=1871053 RepID=UPI002731CB35|nr:2-polyprenylphenol 6-hydroxylase [Phenylobacterium sp.]MDP1615908.1 2-polyprenylphenol 6-hydroxylase [Phenylobacterium sp.]MDP1985788.1 2-polyprenylphenol 6-hydroxylase [Phenylobacterium sp.]